MITMAEPLLAPSAAAHSLDYNDDVMVTGEAVALDVRPAGFILRAAGGIIDVAVSVPERRDARCDGLANVGASGLDPAARRRFGTPSWARSRESSRSRSADNDGRTAHTVALVNTSASATFSPEPTA